MSGSYNAIVPVGFPRPAPATFVAGNTTVAKVLIDAFPAAAASGNLPSYYGGCTMIDCVASSSDGSNKDVLLYTGTIATTQSSGATGAMTTTTSTIPRTTGSFITDGWLVGDLVMTFSPFGTAPNAAMDGILGVVTTVAALTLTVNGTPFAALTLATGTRIVKVTPHLRQTVAATAGTASGIASQGLLAAATDGSTLKTEMKFGPNNMLIAAMQSAVSALPAYVSIDPTVALY